MLYLKSIKIQEKREELVQIDIGKVPLGDFNLLISDNAQGKTRLFNTINFMTSLAYNEAKTLDTDFNSEWIFEIKNGSLTESVKYDVKVQGVNGKNSYYEKIVRHNKLIFSSREKTLFNETKKKKITNYYIPENTPAIVSINEKDFVTIKLIRDFFQRIIYVSSSKRREIHIDPQSIIPNIIGTNLASVLNNWNEKFPNIYREVVNEFMRRYPYIRDVYLTDQQTLEGLKTKFLTFNEMDVAQPITQPQWSDGLFRMLFLIMTTKVPFVENDKIYSPSFIIVDEIENGLDFHSLKYIIDYFKEYSDEIQITLSSHSPLVCELIHPIHWIIVKRRGVKIDFVSPNRVERNLEEELDLFKHKHWDFYSKHISNSNLYFVK